MHYNWPAPSPPLLRTPLPLLVVMHGIAMSLSFFPPARMSVCFSSSFPISQLIAVVVVVNRDGMASKAAAVVDLSSLCSFTHVCNGGVIIMLTTTTTSESVSEWAPPPLSFLVFDKLRRGRGGGERTASFSARRGGPWGWGTVHLGSGRMHSHAAVH